MKKSCLNLFILQLANNALAEWIHVEPEARSVDSGCSFSTISYVGFMMITANTVVNLIANANVNNNNDNNNNNNNNNNNDNNNNNNNAGRSLSPEEYSYSDTNSTGFNNLVKQDPFSPNVIQSLISSDEESLGTSLARWVTALWRSRPGCLLSIVCQLGNGMGLDLPCQEGVC
jgi:hypothetical protein